MHTVSQAKKCFHDWLDMNRPWARTDNVYVWMEVIVAKAAQFLADAPPPQDELMELVAQRDADLLLITKKLANHPEGYEGPCLCAECAED